VEGDIEVAEHYRDVRAREIREAATACQRLEPVRVGNGGEAVARTPS
jgi:hypothetical protein